MVIEYVVPIAIATGVGASLLVALPTIARGVSNGLHWMTKDSEEYNKVDNDVTFYNIAALISEASMSLSGRTHVYCKLDNTLYVMTVPAVGYTVCLYINNGGYVFVTSTGTGNVVTGFHVYSWRWFQEGNLQSFMITALTTNIRNISHHCPSEGVKILGMPSNG